MNFQWIKKKNLVFIVLTSLVILYWTLHKEFSSILHQITYANPSWMFIAIACMFLYWSIEAKTLHMMLSSYSSSYSFTSTLRLVISTQFFNGVTPFASGGQPFQIYALSKESDLATSQITSASLNNFIVYQTTLVILGVLSIISKNIFHLLPPQAKSASYFAFAGFMVNFMVILGLLLIATNPRLTHKLVDIFYYVIKKTPFHHPEKAHEKKVHEFIHHFHDDINLLLHNPFLYCQTIFLNIVKLFAYYLVAYFICLAIHIDSITLFQAVVASAYIMMITSVIPLPGASGGAEISFAVLFHSLLLGQKVTALMLLWRFVTYYFGIFLGMILFYISYKDSLI